LISASRETITVRIGVTQPDVLATHAARDTRERCGFITRLDSLGFLHLRLDELV
jgi:hypothetical protein